MNAPADLPTADPAMVTVSLAELEELRRLVERRRQYVQVYRQANRERIRASKQRYWKALNEEQRATIRERNRLCVARRRRRCAAGGDAGP